MSRALLLGASGHVGHYLRAELPGSAGTHAASPFPGSIPFDAQTDDIASLVDKHGPFSHALVLFGIIDPVRCAVDTTARDINIDATKRALDGLTSAGVMPIYFSSDYVFDGQRGGYQETDPACPVSSYGKQKAEVEKWIMTNLDSWLILRTAKVYDARHGSSTILDTLVDSVQQAKRTGLPITCASDQRFSPTFGPDLAAATRLFMDSDETGLWHVCGPEPLRRRDMLQEVMDRMEIAASVTEKPINNFSLPEPWPVDTSMDSSKYQSRFGARLTTFDQALNLYFDTAS